MRRRSASVFWRSDPVSTTWTTPYDVSMARSAAASDSEGSVFTARKAAPVKWTWLFQKPAVTVLPEQSMTRAFGGTWTAPRGPTAVMRASSTRTTPSGIAAACGDGSTRPPTNAVTRALAAGVDTGAGPHAAASTAAVASAAAPRIPRPRSRVEDILRQEGGHHEVGDFHHVAEPEVDGHAAELSAEPTLLQETHHAEDGVAPGQVEILTLVDPRLRHGHTHGGGVLSGPVCCQTSRPTVAGRCGVVNRLDNLCRHPTRSTPTRMLSEAAARRRSALGHAIYLSRLDRTAGISPKKFREMPDSERRRNDRSVSSRRFATRSSPVTASGGDAEGRYARTPMLKILVTDKEGPMHSRSSALAT